MYNCPTCGAGLIFNPERQKLICYYCENEYGIKEIEELKLKSSKAEENKQEENTYNALVYRCTQCGAELITTDETISTFCSYCGSTAILERKDTKKRKPDYIIPFTKTKEECKQIYRDKIKSAFLAPKNMIDTQQVDKIRGIYIPYWIYSFKKEGEHIATGKRCTGRQGDYLYYDDYEITTNIKAICSGLTHDASANFSDNLSEAIAPFSIKDKKEFSPAYLSGFYADAEDVDSKTYINESNVIADNQATDELKKDKTYRIYNSLPRVKLKEEEPKLGMFPIYFLGTKNKQGDRISYAVVNGQTGKIASEIPIDSKKYILVSLFLALIIFILLNVFLTMTPKGLLGITIIFNLISFMRISKQLEKIKKREQKAEDKGVINKETGKISQYIMKESLDQQVGRELIKVFIVAVSILVAVALFYQVESELIFPLVVLISGIAGVFAIIVGIIKMITRIGNKEKKQKEDKKILKKIKNMYKPLIGLLITVLVLIINPVSDTYYYIGTIISIIMVLWSTLDIIKNYNLLTTRKLPHLEKRGGDENA